MHAIEAARKFFEESNVSGFDKIKDNPQLIGRLFFGIYSSRQFDALKYLYLEKFIPESEKMDKGVNIELKKSEVSELLNLQSKVKYETIRFGYVSLYHKYENFIRELYRYLEKEFSEKIDINKLIEKRFGFNIMKPNCGIGYKVAWICDCVKHQNGIASKRNNPPKEFMKYPKGKEIEIEPDEFERDCDTLRTLVVYIFLATNMLEASIPDSLNLLEPMFDKIKEL